MYQLYKGDTPLATFVPKDASELPYSNGVSVKDKIDGIETRINSVTTSGAVNIASYTEQNPYITPSDGYMWFSSESDTTGLIRIMIRTTNNINACPFYHTVTGVYQMYGTFVRKGMKIFVLEKTTNAVVRFIPLTS